MKKIFGCANCDSKQFVFLFEHHYGWRVQECRECHLVQVYPRPTAKEISALYHNDINNFAPYIAQLDVHRQYFAGKITQIRRLVDRHIAHIALLDIGCAMGVLLEQAGKQGVRAYGLDISKDAVSYCRKLGYKVAAGTLLDRKLPYKPGQFDVITAFEIIEHELAPLLMLERIYTLLKPGGMVIVTTPNHAGIWRTLMGKWWFGYQHPEHVNFFDPTTMTAILSRAGFGRIEVQHDAVRPFPLSFVFRRAADYFPWAGGVLRLGGKLLDGLKLTNPLDPWDDMMVAGYKLPL